MELVANKSVVELELKRALAHRHAIRHNRVLLLRAAPRWRGDAVLSVDAGDGPVPVTVAACPTVLAVLDALAADRPDDGYLVVLTPCGNREVGESVLARALRPEIKPVDRWDLVLQAFGARQADPALTRRDRRWIAEALLDAQPAGGWRRLTGSVLTRAAALNRLAAVRLGLDEADDSPADAAALLQWTLDPAAVARFAALRTVEREGLADWLQETAGPVAGVVFAMVDAGRVTDAVPFGLVAGTLYGTGEDDSAVTVARVRAEERYLGGQAPDAGALRAFGVAAESLVTRWADNGPAAQATALCERAEAIIGELSGTPEAGRALAGRSTVLQAGMDARVAAFAEALAAVLTHTALTHTVLTHTALTQPGALAAAARALARAEKHGRKRDHDAGLRAARAALRLARWLSAPEETPVTLAGAATGMLRSWGWADRALSVIERADTSRVPRLGDVYQALLHRARDRRARLDGAFARKLANWTEAGSATDLVCAENLLERIARPVAAKKLPLLVVLDGLSVAVGCELAEDLTARGTWQEAGRRADGREPVLVTAPSSRTSLLTGTLTGGGQAEENAGFARFWGRTKAVLFRQDDVAPALASEVREALADPGTVVGVVLDGALAAVTYLRAVLDEARRAGRPVILTGSSPAEAVVPVITLFPPDAQIPSGWTKYDAIGHAPAWWTIPPAAQPGSAQPGSAQPEKGVPARAPSAPASRKRARPAVPADDDALFGVADFGSGDMAALEKKAPSLGTRITESPRMASQRQFVRRAPDNTSVAALIDALVQAGGRLTLAEAASAAGQPPVRMSGYLAQITRLLNVDGYAVLQTTDDGRAVELNAQLLRQQFLGG